MERFCIIITLIITVVNKKGGNMKKSLEKLTHRNDSRGQIKVSRVSNTAPEKIPCSLNSENHSNHNTHLTHFKTAAFTLAEVLITLAIIGVVAAVTIPSLTQKYQEKITVTKLKKIYALLTQAYNMAIIEYGTPDKWSFSGKIPIYDENDEIIGYDMSGIEIQRKYLTKYLKGKECKDYFECTNFPDDGKQYNLAMNHEEVYKDTLAKFPIFRLDDGAIITFTNVTSPECNDTDVKANVCSNIEVFFPDNKGYQRRGVNNFMFLLTKDGITPAGQKNSTMFTFSRHCNLTNSLNTNGHGCTAWVLQNENMDYLRCDDLSWEGKHKCD